MSTTPVAARPPRPWRRVSLFPKTMRDRRALVALAPALLALVALFAYPVAAMLLRSFRDDAGGLTLHWYGEALSGANRDIFLTTFRISLEVAVASLVLGFPVAYFLSRLRPVIAGVLMVLVIVPHFVSALVRTFGWMILLGEEGVVNNVLEALRIPGAPYQLLYNEAGVIIGMTHIMLPYAVLTLYAVMRNVDLRLLDAAASLGAGRVTAFRRVYLPQVLPGVAAVLLLSFVIAFGFYLTPALMGGTEQTVIATVIDDEVLSQARWNLGAALAGALLVATLLVLAVINRIVPLRKLIFGSAS
jgi:putative spermidine/putrescine transport system permease protein